MADGMGGGPTIPAGGSHESGGEHSSPQSTDAKDTVQECVSEFISFITSEASDKCQKEKRKTINGDDLLWAMATLGFEDYIEPLKIYLARYREGDTKGSARGGDGSFKRDAAGALPAQNPQAQGQHMIIPCMQGNDAGHWAPLRHGLRAASAPAGLNARTPPETTCLGVVALYDG
ncbi:hypothetical protein GOBAR_DD13048 [Gossypium barbadense]|nr:hypothetical protein GOBAR_DD13048 [Gossypium barbadense]